MKLEGQYSLVPKNSYAFHTGEAQKATCLGGRGCGVALRLGSFSPGHTGTLWLGHWWAAGDMAV